MRVRILSFCFVFILISLQLVGQESGANQTTDYYYPRGNANGLNMTQMLTHLVPFNRANPKLSGPFTYSLRTHRKGNRGFRLGVGVHLSDDGPFGEVISSGHLRLGFEKRVGIINRWSFYRGIDFFTSFGSQNSFSQITDEANGVGIGLPWGVEFAISPGVTLSTETSLNMGIGESIFIKFAPPVSLFLNFYVK
jgi:hypothetical protein